MKAYVAQVSVMSAEIEKLREAQQNAVVLFEKAKASWKQQALQYGKAVLDKAKSEEAVKLFRLAQEVDRHRQAALVERARAGTATSTMPHCQDFDVVDQHICVMNCTGKPVALQDFSLSVRRVTRTAEELFTFPLSTPPLQPNESVSVWYGAGRANLGNHAMCGSLHWSGLDPNSVRAGDVVELRRGEAVVSSVASNQSFHVVETSGRKRKRGSGDSEQSPAFLKSPSPRLSSAERHYGAIQLKRVELSSTQGCKVWLHNQSAEETVVVGNNWKLVVFCAIRSSPETVSLATSIVLKPNGTEALTFPRLGHCVSGDIVCAVFLVDDTGCSISSLFAAEDCLIVGGGEERDESSNSSSSSNTSCAVQ